MPDTTDIFDPIALLAPCLQDHLDRLQQDETDDAARAADTRRGKTSPLDAWAAADDLPLVDTQTRTGARSPAALALTSSDVPRAASLSPDEIAAAIARGEDPYADGESSPVTAPAVPVGATAARMAGFLATLAEPEVRTRFTDPGLILIEVSGDRSLRLRSRWQKVVASVLLTLSDRRPEMAQDTPHVVGALEARSDGGYRSGEVKPLPSACLPALAQGRTAVVIGSAEDLPDTVQPFLHAPVIPASLTRDHVCAILVLTHSRTGRIAEKAVRDRLPPDPALATLPGLALDAAFCERSTLCVADALSRFAARAAPAVAPPGVTLDRVRGLGSGTREELDAVLGDLRAWQAGDLPWPDVPASLLLAGPPGTGKTMIARALASELGWTLIETSFADCQSRDAGHLGTTLRHMRERFEQAQRDAPTVLFFDEMESYGVRSEGRQIDRYMGEIVNAMLQLMNRIATVEGVLFVGASNFFERIDPAIRRSGRIDRKIPVGLPDQAGLRGILDLYLARDDIPDSTREALARRLLGLSGADVENIIKRARSLARASRADLSGDHLQRAADAVANTDEPEDLRRFAVHEAGHALVAHHLGREIHRVVIHGAGGAAESRRPRVHTMESATEDLAISFGGRAAERLLLGSVSSGGGHGDASDLANATRLGLRMLGQWGFGDSIVHHSDAALRDPDRLPAAIRAALDTLLAQAEQRAEEILHTRTAEIARLADRLVALRELDGQEVRKVLVKTGIPEGCVAPTPAVSAPR